MHEDSIPLLKFVVPQGKFAIKHMGQGYHDSGDQFNVSTRELLVGVDSVAKIIDDVIPMPKMVPWYSNLQF